MEVDREYKNLNKWYEKGDTFNTWLYFNEKVLDEDKSGTTSNDVKEKLQIKQVNFFYDFSNSLKLPVQGNSIKSCRSVSMATDI